MPLGISLIRPFWRLLLMKTVSLSAAVLLSFNSAAMAAPLGLSGSGQSIAAAVGKTVAPWDAPGYDVILLAGQSNMAGRGTYDATIDGISDPRVFQFGGYAPGAYNKTIISGVDPLQFPEQIETGLIGPGTTFARAYANSISPNRRVLIVPVAWGGTSLATAVTQNNAACGTTPCWSPTAPGLLYTNAIAQANAAVAAAQAQFPASRFVGTLWIQGETDTNIAQATYATALDTLISGFRSSITGAQNSWFVVGSMLPEYIVGSSNSVNAAHVDTPRRDALTAFAPGPGPGYGNSDNLHFNAAGQRLAGLSLFNAVAAAKANIAVGAAPTPIALPGQPLAVTLGSPTQTTIAATWSAPSSGGATSRYLLQYRISGTTTWSTAGAATSTTFTVPGLSPSTAYDVRVLAYNASGFGTASAIVSGSTAAYVPISPTVSQGNYLFAHEYTSGATTDRRGSTSVALGGSAAVSGNQVNGKSALVLTRATQDYATITGGGVSNVGSSKVGTTTCVIAGKLPAAPSASGIYVLTGGDASNSAAALTPYTSLITQTSWQARSKDLSNTNTNTAAISSPVPAAGAFVIATRYINDGTSITAQLNLNGAGWIAGTGTAPIVGNVASTFTRFDLGAAVSTGGVTVLSDVTIALDSCMQGVAASDETAVINAYKSAVGVP